MGADAECGPDARDAMFAFDGGVGGRRTSPSVDAIGQDASKLFSW